MRPDATQSIFLRQHILKCFIPFIPQQFSQANAFMIINQLHVAVCIRFTVIEGTEKLTEIPAEHSAKHKVHLNRRIQQHWGINTFIASQRRDRNFV